MARAIDKDRGWERIERQLERLPNLRVKVGWPAEKSGDQPHGEAVKGRELFFKSLGEKRSASALRERGHEVALTNAEAARLQEYGAPDLGIPAQGTLGATFDANRSAIEAKMAQLAGSLLDGKGTASGALAALGAWFADLLRTAVGGGSLAALNPAALAAGILAPLDVPAGKVDSAKLATAVSWVVVSA